ncbi:hypothetical protein EV385_5123 [Krasilnikovia cinnamomea]|uniref:Uncharacterized protein n=1 Tax=Krasilnikovia cinnamomea TaxID=349313 RepID=A0A4Q7ZR00_9ACTN|nr:hypothetical protein EV385_5123 [Krasilnikovia cinnamomea]
MSPVHVRHGVYRLHHYRLHHPWAASPHSPPAAAPGHQALHAPAEARTTPGTRIGPYAGNQPSIRPVRDQFGHDGLPPAVSWADTAGVGEWLHQSCQGSGPGGRGERPPGGSRHGPSVGVGRVTVDPPAGHTIDRDLRPWQRSIPGRNMTVTPTGAEVRHLGSGQGRAARRPASHRPEVGLPAIGQPASPPVGVGLLGDGTDERTTTGCDGRRGGGCSRRRPRGPGGPGPREGSPGLCEAADEVICLQRPMAVRRWGSTTTTSGPRGPGGHRVLDRASATHEVETAAARRGARTRRDAVRR